MSVCSWGFNSPRSHQRKGRNFRVPAFCFIELQPLRDSATKEGTDSQDPTYHAAVSVRTVLKHTFCLLIPIGFITPLRRKRSDTSDCSKDSNSKHSDDAFGAIVEFAAAYPSHATIIKHETAITNLREAAEVFGRENGLHQIHLASPENVKEHTGYDIGVASPLF